MPGVHKGGEVMPSRWQGGIREYFLEEVMLKLSHEHCCTIRWRRKRKEFQTEGTAGFLCSCVFLVPMPVQFPCWKYTPVWLVSAKTPFLALIRFLKARCCSEYPQLFAEFFLNHTGFFRNLAVPACLIVLSPSFSIFFLSIIFICFPSSSFHQTFAVPPRVSLGLYLEIQRIKACF